jgi:hypothetical protein
MSGNKLEERVVTIRYIAPPPTCKSKAEAKATAKTDTDGEGSAKKPKVAAKPGTVHHLD